MIQRLPWFERSFPTGMPAHLIPVILERLRGTPARIADRLNGVPPAVLTAKCDEGWTIQENVGHLLDAEPLWQQRFGDLAARRPELAVADLTNRRTHEANHNAAEFKELLVRFRQERGETVAMIGGISETAAAFAAIHPRLGTPMNATDLAYFVAEHDDYHLARIGELLCRAS